MLKAIRDTYFKIRVFIGALRNGIIGLALVIGGWVFLAPPSGAEVAAIGLTSQATASDPLLRAHRMAKIVVMIGNDRVYEMIATQSNTGLTPTEVRDNLEFAADGFGGFLTTASASTVTTDVDSSTSRIRFIPARTN